MNFDEFYWHDSVLTNIFIDRSNPGVADTINLEIEMCEKGNLLFIFEEVYWASFNLNFGIVAKENILKASSTDKAKDSDLCSFYSKWNGLLDEIKLIIYKIELNSTGGEIKIIAKQFRVENLPPN
jgi:hypothetical protein